MVPYHSVLTDGALFDNCSVEGCILQFFQATPMCSKATYSTNTILYCWGTERGVLKIHCRFARIITRGLTEYYLVVSALPRSMTVFGYVERVDVCRGVLDEHTRLSIMPHNPQSRKSRGRHECPPLCLTACALHVCEAAPV